MVGTGNRPDAKPLLGNAPIVDSHAHIFHRGMPFREDAWTRPDYEYALDRYLADLDANGIAFGVVTAASLYGDYNDYTLSALSRSRRLRATVMLEPDTPLAELRAMRDAGVTGVRMQWRPGATLPDFTAHRHAKFLHRLADCDMHVELNCGDEQLAVLLPELSRFPVKLVIDHFGLLRSPQGIAGAGFRAVETALAGGRTWVKISAGFRLDRDQRLAGFARLAAAGGTERLLWGSDAPFVGMEESTDYAGTIAMFEDMVPDAAMRRAISDTALRFYFF